MLEKLSQRRKNFVHEYVKDFNGTQAFIRAGYKEKAAKEGASRLLTDANIKKAIEELTDRIMARKKNDIKQKLILTLEKAMDEANTWRDRLKAVELLGKFSGLWREDTNIQNNIVISLDKEDDGF